MPGPPFANKRPKKKYNYVPPPSSGAHLILVSMFKSEQSELIKNMTKQQVLDFCSRFSQSGLKDNNKIWACMKGLIDKSLVGRHISRDPLYFLLDEGRDLAQKLIALAEGHRLPDDKDESSADSDSRFQPEHDQASHMSAETGVVYDDSGASFKLEAGTFEVVLIVDQRERIELYNSESSLKVETRTLACGDFIWIARPQNMNAHDRTKDIVLDYVVERKRLDDLQSSIFDGRFEQQKLRLKNSGIRRPVYLIEDYGSLRVSNLTSSGLSQAIVNILVHDGIDVERAKNIGHVNDYLITMTKCLEKLYANMDLISCNQDKLRSGEAERNEFMTFSEYQTKGAKITNWTVKEMFAKHLIQITGMSDKRVAVIVKEYPTISALMAAYEKCKSDKEKENLLAKFKIPDSTRTIGPAISKRVYTCYAMANG